MKRSNPKRKRREFLRTFGSDQRVAWVRRQPCAWCGVHGYSVNAHTENGGRGRKGDVASIVPLCASRGVTLGCHEKYDQHLAPFDIASNRTTMRHVASNTADAWERLTRNAP